MDKNAIKKYAIWARRELIDRVTKRAAVFGVSKDDLSDPNADSVNGHLLSDVEKRQRQALIRRIEEKGYEQVMEEVAYTWFNRVAALRFMEVNGYLPTHIRVFTDDEGRFRPQILSEAIHLDLDGLNKSKVYQLKDSNQEEELFKYLLIVQCNALNGILPGMFQKIEDYTELLLPDYLLREGSVIEQMVTLIPEDDWKDQVQIIGWLYQYYNTEPKDKVFADLKKNIKISKEHIPAATQLFTPDWIVHYMVENSLGRLWLEGHPNNELKSEWKYYLDEAEQEPDVQVQLAEIRKQYAALKPEEILTIDPCAGSGHILCVLFDVLVRIYEDYGYTAREAAASIVQNNLWGLDIDDRAAQLAYFAVMMKARQYDRRFFTREVQPHVYAIQESNGIHRDHLHYLGRGMSDIERNNAVNQMNALLDVFIDAKEYGSILQPGEYDWALLSRFVADTTPEQQVTFDESGVETTQAQLRLMIAQGQALAQKYHVVVTNPPYMGGSGMGDKLSRYVKDYYPDSRSDLFAVFIERCHELLLQYGFQGMITMHTWMFLGSYDSLRKSMQKMGVLSLIHLGIKAFEEIGNDVVQTAAFILQQNGSQNRIATFVRLVDYKDYEQKQKEFFNLTNYYCKKVSRFIEIPGFTYAYWVSDAFIENFHRCSFVEEYGEFTGSQNVTGDNERFLRYFWEVDNSHIEPNYWVFYAKGGDYRKYYGNIQIIIDWRESARSFYENNRTSNLLARHLWYKEGITYSAVTSRGTGFRLLPEGCVFDKGGPSIILDQHLWVILALLNSKVAEIYFNVFNPSINLQVKDIKAFPLIMPRDGALESLAMRNVAIAKQDWDSRETSYGFLRSPLILKEVQTIAEAYRSYANTVQQWFEEAQDNEMRINEIVKELYSMPEVLIDLEARDIPVLSVDLRETVINLISYAVGCMVGRYSLDKPGLAFAGGAWDASQYVTYPADKDGILPITDDEYFADDIVTMFVNWLKTVYGADTLEENLRFISDALGGKGSPREVIRNYFLNDFYKDHLKIYQKRPIYWLFDSGKKNGFKALVYMHRYQPDTIARVRTDYVHEMQSRYRTAIADVEQRLNDASTSERVKLTKRLNALQAQADELRQYEEKIHHLADQMIAIDLDDGVKVNYAKFADVLATIK